MVKKAFEAVVSRGRIDSGRLLRAPAVRYPIPIPADLIDFFDEVGVEDLVRLQHPEETSLFDAFFQVSHGPFDGNVVQRGQFRRVVSGSARASGNGPQAAQL